MIVTPLLGPIVAAILIVQYGTTVCLVLSGFAALPLILATTVGKLRKPVPRAPTGHPRRERRPALRTGLVLRPLWIRSTTRIILTSLTNGLYVLPPLLASEARTGLYGYAALQAAGALGLISERRVIVNALRPRGRRVVVNSMVAAAAFALVAYEAHSVLRLVGAVAVISVVLGNLKSAADWNPRDDISARNVLMTLELPVSGLVLVAFGLLIDAASIAAAALTAAALVLAAGAVIVGGAREPRVETPSSPRPGRPQRTPDLREPSAARSLDVAQIEIAAERAYWLDHRGVAHLDGDYLGIDVLDGHTAEDRAADGAAAWAGLPRGAMRIPQDGPMELALVTATDGDAGDPTAPHRGPAAQRLQHRTIKGSTAEAMGVARDLAVLELAQFDRSVHKGAREYLQRRVLGMDVGPEPAWVANFNSVVTQLSSEQEWAVRVAPLFTGVQKYGPLITGEAVVPDACFAHWLAASTPLDRVLLDLAVWYGLTSAERGEGVFASRERTVHKRLGRRLRRLQAEVRGERLDVVTGFRRLTTLFDGRSWPAGAERLPIAQLFAIAMMANLRWIARCGLAKLDRLVDLQRVRELSGCEPVRRGTEIVIGFGCVDLIVVNEGDLVVGIARVIDEDGGLLSFPCALSAGRLEWIAWAASARDVPEAARSVLLHELLIACIENPWLDLPAAAAPAVAELESMARRRNVRDAVGPLLARAPSRCS
jgi:hypothetical protein